MSERCLITSCSNKYVPSVLNLIGSIKKNYPSHPMIYIYDLGLLGFFKKTLEQIDGVKVLPMPHFSSFWRACYTWKTYILSHPISDLNFYLDAGCEVYEPLDEIFSQIDTLGYCAIEQQISLDLITPMEYREIFPIEPEYYTKNCITAGMVGFKKNSCVTLSLNKLFDAALSGLCLGFSEGDSHRNRGVNKTIFVRNCKLFRHETTLWSMLFRQEFKNQNIVKVDKTGEYVLSPKDGHSLIRNFRLNFTTLTFAHSRFWSNKHSIYFLFADIYVKVFIFLKKINLKLKSLLGFKGIYKV